MKVKKGIIVLLDNLCLEKKIPDINGGFVLI